jgi:MoxR-like ATPase
LSLAEVGAIQRQCAQVKVADSLREYLLTLVRATRNHPDLTLGVSPRGSVAFYRAVQALAYLEGRDYAIPDDIKGLAIPVLAHRLIPLGAVPPRELLIDLLAQTPIP